MIIKIKNLRLKTIIGIHKWEENFEREIIINIKITSNKKLALISDKIEDAIDYDIISTQVKNFVAQNQFKLIEKLAQGLIDLILSDKRITKCKIEIDKVGAVEFADSASITIEQTN